MILGIKVRSTNDFSFDRKSSCSISLTFLWLSHEINISATNSREFGMSHSVVKGENSSFMMFFSSSLDWISLNAISQSPVKPTWEIFSQPGHPEEVKDKPCLPGNR